ncbi:Mitotic checkpoint serine/threonine-protein kinase BUB1 [Larimichthys crocea]|uniref:Uncharacterized protein n=1 Tax=Larimichthys crocea TaxID=215358 RepID=A0ACD3R0P0_LARCR|nr:Mitotic checkpoint serine/threonine-protein kinase BUB1 [Larimichthys crocea]
MSPDRAPGNDVSMSATPAQTTTAVQLMSDPWDDGLISDLLSSLTPPLTSHPRCITWPCNLPNISPKMTIEHGKRVAASRLCPGRRRLRDGLPGD